MQDRQTTKTDVFILRLENDLKRSFFEVAAMRGKTASELSRDLMQKTVEEAQREKQLA